MRWFARPHCWALILALAAVAAPDAFASEPSSAGLHLVQGVVATSAMPDGSPINDKTFYAGEEIQFYTKLSWDVANPPGGAHRVIFKWYTDDKLILTFGGAKEFSTNPTDWWTSTHVAHFQPGHYRVELYVDGALLASDEFDVCAGVRPYEPPEESAIRETGRALLLKGDMPGFDALATGYRESAARSPSGTWKLTLLYGAIGRSWFAPSDAAWGRLEELAEVWLRENPLSPTAVAVDARLLYWHAWAWRGEGASDQVDPQSWAQYRELLERARRVLDEHADVARKDPEAEAIRILIARQQGASSQSVLELASQALDRHPYYYPIHYAAVIDLLPQWGGSSELIVSYVQRAVERSREHEGTQAYARIYFYLARKSNDNPLDDLNLLGAKWPPMKQSLQELVQAYPSEFNEDVRRAITCLAGDAPATRAFGRASTGDIVAVAWWDTRDRRKVCNDWAFEGKVVHGSIARRIVSYVDFLRGFGSQFWARIRLAALAGFFGLEGVLALLARLTRRSGTDPSVHGTARVLNPLQYPRTYRIAPGSNPFVTRTALWMMLLGSAVAYLLNTIPWANPAETGTIVAVCVAVAIAGALVILNEFTACLVLRPDSMTVSRLIGQRTMRRGDLLGVRGDTASTRRRTVAVVNQGERARRLRLPLVWGEDEAFRDWFGSLPTVAESAGRANSPPPGPAAVTVRGLPGRENRGLG